MLVSGAGLKPGHGVEGVTVKLVRVGRLLVLHGRREVGISRETRGKANGSEGYDERFGISTVREAKGRKKAERGQIRGEGL